MKIAVTGASGFIGSSLVKALFNENAEVHAIARHIGGLPQGMSFIRSPDLRSNASWCNVIEGSDVVVHCAGQARELGRSGSAQEMLLRANAGATHRLAADCAVAGVKRIIFLSSVKAAAETTLPGKPLTSSVVPAPVSFYGRSKLEAERRLIESAERSGLEYVIIRAPMVYGPLGNGNIQKLIKAVAHGVPLPVGLALNKRSLIFIDNLLDMLLASIRSRSAAGCIFFVSDGEDLSTREIVEEIGRGLSRPARIPSSPIAPMRWMLAAFGKSGIADQLFSPLQVDISHTFQVLGWHPSTCAREGVRTTARQYSRAGGKTSTQT